MQHIHLDKVSSTQAYLLEEFPDTPGHLLISCEEQLAGFGRRGNSWDSDKGSLCFSFTISPTKILSLSSIEISIIITNFFKAEFRKDLKLKWPNDIMIDDKKCGGLIINNSKQGQLVVGVGLNISPLEDITNYPIAADSIFSTDIIFSKRNLAARIYRYALDNRVAPSLIQNQWNSLCAHLNQTVSLYDEERVNGLFKGIGSEGQALIEVEDRVITKFSGSLRY